MCYTQICPRFECRDEYTIHTCVYCVLTLNAGPGRGVGVCGGCVCVCVCVRPGIQSEDQNQFFTFKVRTFWQSEVKISVLALWLCALSSLFHNMGVGGMDVILFLYVSGMFRGVWKNVLTLNVLYTDLSLLWMPGRTHYTHVCILCPHFESGTGRGVCVCVKNRKNRKKWKRGLNKLHYLLNQGWMRTSSSCFLSNVPFLSL